MTMISQELAASLPAPSGGEVKTHGATPTCVPACLPPSVWRLPNSTRRRRCQIVKFYWRVSSPTQPHLYSVCFTRSQVDSSPIKIIPIFFPSSAFASSVTNELMRRGRDDFFFSAVSWAGSFRKCGRKLQKRQGDPHEKRARKRRFSISRFAAFSLKYHHVPLRLRKK